MQDAKRERTVYDEKMIAHLTGKVLYASERFVVLDAGGVGYKVRVTADTLYILRKNVGEVAALWIHTAVREDALDLYGFQSEPELAFFELLIGVSGIGPKSALGIMNISPVAHLKEAIAAGDVNALTKVSGIGAKNAQKIILELRDKLGGEEGETVGTVLGVERDVIEGLVGLGYTERDAREALRGVSPDIKGTSMRIKEALKLLGR